MLGSEQQKGPLTLSKPIFKDGCFHNPWDSWRLFSIIDVMQFWFWEKSSSSVPYSTKELDEVLPIMKPDFSKFETSPVTGVRTMWVCHSSVLVQLDGITFLTDPVFSQNIGPVNFQVLKGRYRNPACQISELPKIDAVVISHNHYDHLDEWSVLELNKRFGNSLKWFAPLGLQSWLYSCGCSNVEEMSWWESGTMDQHANIRFVCTPAQHWSRRGIFDTNRTLWCSWSVIGPKHRFFFAGDTGYCQAFKEIGQEYGPFDLAAIPIGAYEPRWFMAPQHINPSDAVQIHIDIHAKHSLGIHWATFRSSHEHYLEPPLKVQEALKRNNLHGGEFFVLKHGEIKVVGDDESGASHKPAFNV